MTVSAFLVKTPLFDRILRREFDGGLYNGYVAFSGYLPQSYQSGGLFGELDKLISVHGGITFDQDVNFSEPWGGERISIINTEVPHEGIYRVIGFDTLHLDDTMDYWTFERTKSETLYLLEQIEKLLVEFQIKKLSNI